MTTNIVLYLTNKIGFSLGSLFSIGPKFSYYYNKRRDL